ncbi:MAG: MEDS domain-containing protein [Terriglobales bacterium]
MSSGASVHSVQFYDSHTALMDRLCALVSAGLLVGDSLLIVATDEHREQLVAALYNLKVDVLDYAWANRIVMCDAEELLAEFMVDGLPDPELFRTAIGDLLNESRPRDDKDAGVIVFGEMVAVLWGEGNRVAALALEHLWNNLLAEQTLNLNCAYPRALFASDEAGVLTICQSHSHVVGVPAHPTTVN